MSEKIRLVQGDTRPSLVTTLTDSTNGAAINITGATVRLKFRAAGSPTVRSTIVGTITNAAGGVVVFDWSDDPTSLDGAPGDYEAEIEITFADNTIQTVYDLLKFKLRQDF
jgi:hypothetical protein